MDSFSKFMSRPRCRICDSRVCPRPGFCDDAAQIDRAIVTCAQVCEHVTLDDCLSSASFKGLDEGQVFLTYKAGELLARKR
jgi:hypothetical protein